MLATDDLGPHFTHIWVHSKCVVFYFYIYLYQFFENFMLLQLLPMSTLHFPKNPTSCSFSLPLLLNELDQIRVIQILLAVG